MDVASGKNTETNSPLRLVPEREHLSAALPAEAREPLLVRWLVVEAPPFTPTAFASVVGVQGTNFSVKDGRKSAHESARGRFLLSP